MRTCILLSLVAASLLALASAGETDLPVLVTPPSSQAPSDESNETDESNKKEPKSELPIKIWPEGAHKPADYKWCDHARAVARANTLFAADLYKTLAAASSTLNIVTSPFALSTGLAIAYAGSDKMTRHQMYYTLRFDVIPTHCYSHEGFRQILYQFTEPKHKYSIKIAIRAYIEQNFGLLQSYVNQIRSYYPIGPKSLPFQSSPAQSLAAINNWVSTATDGKFPELMSPDAVTSDTKLVLVNVIGFKGRWQHEFPPWRTRRQRFHKSVTTHVDMMHTSISPPKLRYAHLRSLRARVVELPYTFKHSRVSMFIVLPYWRTKLEDVEKRFNWNPETMRLRHFHMAVALPRFSVHQHVQLDPYLKRMNMTNPFTPAANFSGIDGRSDLKIDGIFHEATLNVTETGTEAGVASTMSKARGAHRFVSGFEFIVNRPFLFFIYDFGTRTLLFTGRFLK